MPRMVTPYAEQLARWSLEGTDRAAWLELRRAGLGGSEIAAVCGMDARRTRWEVYLSKVAPELDADEPADDSRLAEMIWFGHQMEDVAARRFRERHPGVKTARCGLLASRQRPWMRVNVDYLGRGCPDGLCVVEVKNRAAWVSGEWDAGGDAEKIPDAAAVQALWGLAVLGGPAAGYTHSHLLAVIGGNELREYKIAWDGELAATLIEEGSWFWHEHVLPKVPPPPDATERTGKILARLWDTDPDSVITADDDTVKLVARLREAEDAADRAQLPAALLRHELMTLLGPAEILVDGNGRKLVTWKQNSTFREGDFRREQPAEFAKYAVTREVTDTKRLAEDNPGLYRQYRSRAFRVAPAPREG